MNHPQRSNTIGAQGCRERGFTLVEMIVALAIFSIVSVVALGALVKIVSANKKAQSLQSSISNLSFALDAMSRELRTGKNYHCESNDGSPNYTGEDIDLLGCPSGLSDRETATLLGFASAKRIPDSSGTCAAAYAYRFRPEGSVYVLEKAVQTDCDEGISSTDFENIIDENVEITGYFLSVQEDEYPRVTVRISGYSGVREREKTYFDVQTTISQRVP